MLRAHYTIPQTMRTYQLNVALSSEEDILGLQISKDNIHFVQAVNSDAQLCSK